jgi:hypothetical protein
MNLRKFLASLFGVVGVSLFGELPPNNELKEGLRSENRRLKEMAEGLDYYEKIWRRQTLVVGTGIGKTAIPLREIIP